MKNVYVSKKSSGNYRNEFRISSDILNDYDYFRGERQKCLRIVQRKPPSELVMSFLAEQPVSARIVIRRQGEQKQTQPITTAPYKAISIR